MIISNLERVVNGNFLWKGFPHEEKFLTLVLYPALADGLSKGEPETLKGIVEGMEGVEPAQIIDAISQRISASEIAGLASMVPDDQKYQ